MRERLAQLKNFLTTKRPPNFQFIKRFPGGTSTDPATLLERWQVLDNEPARQLIYPNALDLTPYAHNIENCIGTVSSPVGIAGPLRINGTHAVGDFVIPMATTEATLVASFHRGARLITISGGCNAVVIHEGISRAPGYVFNSMQEALEFAQWIKEHQPEIQQTAEATTHHGKLLDLSAAFEGNYLFLIFDYETGDAAGQNIATIATQAACEFIQQQCPIKPRLAFVESNLSGDKKATSGCFSHVRGKKVMAEVTIPNELLRKILRTTAVDMTEYNRLGTTGAMISGAMGVNGHYSNGLAALFLACGQDVACVAEASIGITRMSVDDSGNLRTSVTLPNLPVGTVGGGTSLPTQKACLDLLGMHGTGKAKAFAEICAATCLAGELSLIGALCANEFSKAHQKYARPK